MRGVISPTSSRKIVPPFGLLEFAALVAIGSGEAAFHVAEQLGLEERFSQAGAVDRDERLRRSRRGCVYEPREHVLADAALAGNEYLRITRRRAAGRLDKPQHGRALADHDSGAARRQNQISQGYFSLRCCAAAGQIAWTVTW